MIAGIGIDIVATNRFQRFLDEGNVTLMQKLFTDREHTFCSARKSSADSFAARFAAKEAFLKALGTGLRDGISWLDMEVVNDDLGKPDLILSGTALELFKKRGFENLFLSLSHDGGNAVALVVLESL